MSDRRVPVACPYCGFVNSAAVSATEWFPRPRVVLCDCDEGGCDSYFVAKIRVSVETEGLKIEGCEPPPRTEGENEA